MKDKYIFAKQLVLNAGEIIKENLENYKVNTKSSEKDLVTDVDVLIEKYIFDNINERFPLDYTLGEETVDKENLIVNKNLWILDPIDGTVNFIHQQKNFAVALSYYENEKAVFGLVLNVMSGDLYSAYINEGAYYNGKKIDRIKPFSMNESLISFSPKWMLNYDLSKYRPALKVFRNYRYLGVAAVEICMIATGELNCYLSLNINPWDYSAAKLILEEAGGCMVDLNNNSITGLEFTGIIAGHHDLIKEFFSLL